MSGPDGSEPAYRAVWPCKACGNPAGMAPAVNHGGDTGWGPCLDPCHQAAYAKLGVSADPKQDRISFLERKRAVTLEDMKVKMEAEDWHGVQDCASDLRDADSELDGLRWPG